MSPGSATAEHTAPAKRDRTHWLYLAVIAVILGMVVGFVFPAWTNQVDRAELSAALSGEDPFDEATMIDAADDPRTADRDTAAASH